MLATTETVEILEDAELIANMVMNSDIMEKYKTCLYKLKNSPESQAKIKKFVRIKEHYEEVQRFGKYHPDQLNIMKQTRILKREMDLDPLVAEFKVAENDLQGLLDEISLLIGGAVSKNIKVPVGNPFFDTGQGSGCGSGGSCGCG